MPSRTFDKLRITSWTHDFMGSPSPSHDPAPTILSPEDGVLSITGSGSNSGSIPGAAFITFFQQYRYFAEATIDFDAFPSIPLGALITRVRFTLDATFNVTASANCTASAPNGTSVARAGGFITVIDMPDIDLEDSDDVANAGTSTTASASSSGSVASTEQEFDFSGSPITRAAFVAQFETFRVELGPFSLAGNVIQGTAGGGDAPQTGGASLNFSYLINNFSMIVEYNDSGFSYTLDPPGGDVEPGQKITVLGGAPPDLKYAAVIEPDTVIPLEPGIDPDGNPFFEIPYPPTEDCTGCLAECTECDECYDACNEDLDGEECIACLEACFECLQICLENLDDAESCIGSSQEPPETPVIIIVTSPPKGTQFNGTVPLGNFNIVVARASGLYQFVPNKRNDTIYTSERDGTTVDIKIPNAGGKTAIIKG